MGRDQAPRPRSDRTALGFAAVGAGFLAVAAVAYFAFGEWYADDACPRAQWQCNAAVYGLGALIITLPLAAFSLLVGFLIWVFGPLLSGRGRSER